MKNSSDKIQQNKILKGIGFVKKYFKIYPLYLEESDVFADLKVKYKRSTGINKIAAKKNDLDFLIAATAIVEDAVLVSNDKIFEVISSIEPSLKFENWMI